ncbi:MAG: PucR family transcriptional regulator [Candidatus Dormibacteria bacterium]
MAEHRKEAWPTAGILPPAVTARLMADTDIIARRMTRRIAGEGTLRGAEFRGVGYLRSIMVACREALRTMVRLLHDGRGPRAGDLDRLGLMGARQAEMGVPLEELLRAYRLAAKLVWQEMVGDTTGLLELPPATVIAVTSQVLEYLDEISGAVGRSYLETRERLMRQRDRDRDRVLQRLLVGDDSVELQRLAATSDLALQPPYRPLACAIPSGSGDRALDVAWRRGALVVADEPGAWIVLVASDADPDALWQAMRRAIDGTGEERAVCGVGPVAGSLADVADAARQARQALQVGRRLHPDRDFHNDADLGIYASLAADRLVLHRFVERVLGRLLAGGSARHQDLLRTLEALLDTRNVSEAAIALGVHRHTLVYRSQRLRDLGVDIDTPEQRHQLWLALRGLRLLSEDVGL